MINLSNVYFSYDNRNENGIKNINLEIKQGECVLFCGESGCGKTTVTRLINGLIPHFYQGDLKGDVEVCNKDIKNTAMSEISEYVGSVFQNPRTQFFNTDTDSEIVFGLENKGIPQDKLKEKLSNTVTELGLENLQNRSIFELSGGEKQKIAFASVYATKPDVFVLDEPSSNLDKDNICVLANLLKRIKAMGKTIVIAEHRLWYLMDIVDKVVFMQNGEITKQLSIAEFKSLSNEQIKNMGLRGRSLVSISEKSETLKANVEQLHIKDICVSYNKKEILKNVSFSVSQGEVLGIIGANGTGKTTLARTICGLQKVNAGEISLGSKSLSEKSRTSQSYMVMQDVNYQLFCESVENECSLGTKNIDKSQIEQVLNLLDLSEFKQRHPISLSGGQKQRLAVAVSLLCDKKIIVFDEPTSGLDLKSMKEVGALTQLLTKQGKLVIVITHDYEFISDICSRVISLDDINKLN